MTNKHRGMAPIKKAVALAATAALVGVGAVLALAGPASAHTAGATPTVSCKADGSASVTWKLTNDYGTSYTIENSTGTAPLSGSVGKNTSKNFTETIASPAAGKVSTVNFTARWSDFSQRVSNSITVDATCVPPTPPTTVNVPVLTVSTPLCDAPGQVVGLPDGRGQNNSYEGDGYRLFLSPAYTPGDTGTFEVTVQKIGKNGQPGYPNGTVTVPVSGTKYTLTVEPATGVTQSTDPHGSCYVEPPTVEKPQIQDYLPTAVCTADGIRTAAFVADNTGSNVDVTYTINGTEYVVKAGEARHIENLPVAKDGTHFTITAADQKWEFDAVAEDCPPTVIKELLPPQFVDVCGIESDLVQIPNDLNHVKYIEEDKRKDGVGLVEVTATADEGFVLNEDGDTTQTWGHEFTNEECATVPPTEEPTPTPPVTTPPTSTPSATPPTEIPAATPPTETCTTIGAVNVPQDSPLYTTDLDADGDGVACESTVAVVKKAPTGTQTGVLAYTGNEGLLGVGVIALVLILAGLGIWIAHKRSKA